MDIVGVLIVLGVIIFSMMLHEVVHGWVAFKLGDETAKTEGRLTLNPIRHLDPFMSLLLPLLLFISGGPVFGGAKPVPINTRNLKFGVWGMALVALAGPLVNFLLAFGAFLVGHWTGMLGGVGLGSVVVTYFVMVNLGFGVFNLIPIPPLDGSRVLYAIAPDGVRMVMERMERIGIWIVLILIIVCGELFSSLMLGAMQGVYQFFNTIVGL